MPLLCPHSPTCPPQVTHSLESERASTQRMLAEAGRARAQLEEALSSGATLQRENSVLRQAVRPAAVP